ncbi:MAG: hypothetical protein RMK50_06800 [Nitrososphaerota archaeon]|nr:hypothetical protein [Candidatus Bathyarchaeota archaeon]MDW8194508.1 hypothetical protein [Nitrososphaerota archaeon]
MQKLEFRLKQVGMPELPVEERLKTFNEVALGYSEEQALAEAARCLQYTRPYAWKCVRYALTYLNL